MRERLGISLQSEAVVGVIVRRGTIVWHAEEVRPPAGEEGAKVSLQKLLSRLPRRRFGRMQTTVVLGSSESQVRHLEELPPMGDARTIARIVSENSGRFFLRNGRPLVTSNVRLTASDSAWAAAFERPLAGMISSCCRRAKCDLRMIIPALVTLPAVLGDSFRWRDGDCCSSIRAEAGELREIARCLTAAAQDSAILHETLPAPLRELGDQAVRYAAAHSAALTPEGHPLGIGHRQLERLVETSSSRLHLGVAAVALLVAVAGVALAPGMSAWRVERHAQTLLAGVRTEQREIAVTRRRLGQASQALQEASALLANRHSMLALLGQVTSALPPDAALVTLRSDSTGGYMITLAPRAAAVLAAMDSVRLITSVEISGPVTRESVGDRTLERATLNFRWVPDRGER